MGSRAWCHKDHAKMTNSRFVMLIRDKNCLARSANGRVDCLGSTVITAAASAGRCARRKSRRCVLERDLEKAGMLVLDVPGCYLSIFLHAWKAGAAPRRLPMRTARVASGVTDFHTPTTVHTYRLGCVAGCQYGLLGA